MPKSTNLPIVNQTHQTKTNLNHSHQYLEWALGVHHMMIIIPFPNFQPKQTLILPFLLFQFTIIFFLPFHSSFTTTTTATEN